MIADDLIDGAVIDTGTARAAARYPATKGSSLPVPLHDGQTLPFSSSPKPSQSPVAILIVEIIPN
jgi:hypothetical protein